MTGSDRNEMEKEAKIVPSKEMINKYYDQIMKLQILQTKAQLFHQSLMLA